MKVISTSPKEITISFSREEIGFINNAINETLNALDDWDFSIRTGYTIEEARQLLKTVGQSIKTIPK